MHVFLFHGAGSLACVAAFSELDIAKAWIKEHSLTGYILRYDVDYPAFESRLQQGTLRSYHLRDKDAPRSRERFVDISWEYRFFYGVGEEDPGFRDACDRWHAETEDRDEP